MRNGTLCKEFIGQGGVELILSATDLPCMPIRFADPDVGHMLSHLFRTISEHDHEQVVSKLIVCINDGMVGCSRLWQDPGAHNNWLSLDRGDESELREQLGRLKGVSTQLGYLGDILTGLTWSHARPAAALIKCLGVSSGSAFISDLGLLHRRCFQEHVALKPSASTPSASTPSASTAPAELIDTAESARPASDQEKISGARHMVRHIHAVLAKFFKGKCAERLS